MATPSAPPAYTEIDLNSPDPVTPPQEPPKSEHHGPIHTTHPFTQIHFHTPTVVPINSIRRRIPRINCLEFLIFLAVAILLGCFLMFMVGFFIRDTPKSEYKHWTYD